MTEVAIESARLPRRWPRVLALSVALLAGVVVVAAAALFVVAEWKLHCYRDVVSMPLSVAPSEDMVAEGERNFHIFGCFGCHGEKGNILFDQPMVARVAAPDLREKLPLYDDAQLVDLIRRGVKRDGTTAIVMPTNTTGRIADTDLAALVSYMRTLPEPSGEAGPTISIGPLGYAALALGKVPLSAVDAPSEVPPRTRPAGREGEYLVGAICRECHELDAVRDDGFGMVTPALREIVPAYDPDRFRSLLRTGRGIGDRDLGLMSDVARLDLSHLTDGEIAAIYDYLADR